METKNVNQASENQAVYGCIVLNMCKYIYIKPQSWMQIYSVAKLKDLGWWQLCFE